jgi:hypothetical protein
VDRATAETLWELEIPFFVFENADGGHGLGTAPLPVESANDHAHHYYAERSARPSLSLFLKDWHEFFGRSSKPAFFVKSSDVDLERAPRLRVESPR